ncbi:MAG: MerR family DNA-binding transcriptional regulator, partial [Bacillota bacterium]
PPSPLMFASAHAAATFHHDRTCPMTLTLRHGTSLVLAVTDMSYRVGEVASMTGISVRTLHHYDDIGLLRPARSGSSGYRLYTPTMTWRRCSRSYYFGSWTSPWPRSERF